ncbi:GNAT family N-acetyltransferase [Emcibacter sp. SYSU 3D8]|uniref:GNAT family N-acetyltransferase n=1 Tax=Emcibacter sp. SYSU 3D8 TaxID=3133969 RepID=UPI0031FE7EA2
MLDCGCREVHRLSIATPQLDTARLFLRPLEMADAAAVQRVFPQWEIVRYLASHIPWPYPADAALTYFRDRALPAIERGIEWHWSIRPKSAPDRLIGMISLMSRPDENRGFWLDPAWQGRGLMTEACEAVTEFWFDVLGYTVLRAPKAAANTPSRRISARGGMRVIAVDERDYVSGRLRTELWEITRDEWLARRR